MSVPTNLITGFLGAGKTTAIRHWLSTHRPRDARWAVLVNEFGEVGVDAAVLADGADVEELPGGCLCCTLGVPFRVALKRVLQRVRPQRLLVEPTGIGHPAKILDILREQADAGALELRATVTVVDPRRLADERVRGHEAFIDQAELADVLIATHIDRCTTAEREMFRRWAAERYPPKARIAEVEYGRIDPAWLDEPLGASRCALHHSAHAGHDSSDPLHDHDHDHDHDTPHSRSRHGPLPGHPIRLASAGFGVEACGWIFHREERFQRAALLALMERLRGAQRIKGVLRTGKDWLHVDAVQGDIQTRPAAWRGDSRLEVIGPPAGWTFDAIETALRGASSQPW